MQQYKATSTRHIHIRINGQPTVVSGGGAAYGMLLPCSTHGFHDGRSDVACLPCSIRTTDKSLQMFKRLWGLGRRT